MAVGRWVREHRTAKKLSIANAARRAGLTQGWWHAIENATPSASTGKPSKPSVPFLRVMADALDADRAELLELAGYPEDAAYDKAFHRPADPVITAYSNKLVRVDDRTRRIVERIIDDALADELQP